MDNRETQNRRLEDFFKVLEERMKLVAGYEAGIARFESPRFNVFDYIQPDENKVTAILADFLDPRGRHGQGDIFLSSFLARIGFDKPSKDAIAAAKVRREERTGYNRRLDLTIRAGPYIVALENKKHAREQKQQISDYLDYLESIPNVQWFFIFLKDGFDPEECDENRWKQKREEGRALAFSYSQLSAWLRSCVTWVPAERVRAFVNDMATWTENLRGGSKVSDLKKQIILDFIKSNPSHAETLLAVQDNGDFVRRGLISAFAKTLEKELKGNFPPPDWEYEA
jgi:hypothetical protein